MKIINSYFLNISLRNERKFIKTKKSLINVTIVSILFSNLRDNSVFLEASETDILITNCSIKQNHLISDYNDKSFIDCNECNAVIKSSTIENNYLNNYKWFYCYGNNGFVFQINDSKIIKNYGNSIFFNIVDQFSNIEITNCDISENNISNLFLIQNSQEGNVYFMNLRFEKNNAKKIILLKNIKKIIINSIVFYFNNWLYKDLKEEFIGPCILLENVANLVIAKLEITENFGLNNNAGLAIIQSKGLFLLNSSTI